jgi:hypothetical protein
MMARRWALLCLLGAGCWPPCGECPPTEPMKVGRYQGTLKDGRLVDVNVTDREVTVTSVDERGDTWVARYAIQ